MGYFQSRQFVKVVQCNSPDYTGLTIPTAQTLLGQNNTCYTGYVIDLLLRIQQGLGRNMTLHECPGKYGDCNAAGNCTGMMKEILDNVSLLILRGINFELDSFDDWYHEFDTYHVTV